MKFYLLAHKDSEDDVEVITSEDERIKVIGEIFSNDSSRKILKLISNDTDMTAKEIAQETKLSLSLVKHHLNRMHSVGMVRITKTEKSVKGQKMKYYLATKQSFLIVPHEKTTDYIFESLKKYSKFAAIGIAGIVSWMMVKPRGDAPRAIYDSNQDDFTSGIPVSQTDEWSSGSESKPDFDLVEETSKEQIPEPQPEPRPEPEPEPVPSHSGVDNFELNVDSDFADSGSVSLDRTVYPEPFGLSGAESVEPLVLSIIIPIAVVVSGIIIERLLTRWFSKKKIKSSLD